MSEWVGIDGATNTSLIQAGVHEVYDPSTNLVYTYAWWEILPAFETFVALPVAPGNVMTVAIGQVSPGLWVIRLTDDTTGQTFTTAQAYLGPADSAEWIVEAPTGAGGAVDTLGQYAPAVSFTGLGLTGTQVSLAETVMVQNGVVVSTPSALTPAGFNVAYGAVAPTPP